MHAPSSIKCDHCGALDVLLSADVVGHYRDERGARIPCPVHVTWIVQCPICDHVAKKYHRIVAKEIIDG